MFDPTQTQPLSWRMHQGKPIPSDHAPLLLDLDSQGQAIDAGWARADARTEARRA